MFRGDSCGDRLSWGDWDHHCIMGRIRERPWLCHALRRQSKSSLIFEILLRVASGFWTRACGGRGTVKTDQGPVSLYWAGRGDGRHLQLHHHARVHWLPGQHHWARQYSPCPDLSYGISYIFRIHFIYQLVSSHEYFCKGLNCWMRVQSVNFVNHLELIGFVKG